MRAAVVLALLVASMSPAARAAECIFEMDRKDVLVGPCKASEREPTKGFSVTSPNGSITARVTSTGGGVGEAFWNGGVKGQEADILIGPVVLVGACWASDKVKLCMAR